MSKALLDKAKTYEGTAIEIGIHSKAHKGYVATPCKFLNADAVIWKIGDASTADLWANIEIIASGKKIQLPLEKFINAMEGKQLMEKKYKYKELSLPHPVKTVVTSIAAVPFINSADNEIYYNPYNFKPEDGAPTDYNKGKEITKAKYKTEDEAIKVGIKLIEADWKRQQKAPAAGGKKK